MAAFQTLPLQSQLNSGSALSLPVTGNDFEHDDIGVACSPFTVSCPTANRSYSLLSHRVSKLTLRPASCNSNSTTYQNGQITPTSPQLLVVKADKTPFPPPLPNTWAWSPEKSSCLASLPPTRSEVGPSNWYGSTLQSPQELLRWQCCHSGVSKPLLSPIKFTSDVEARAADQTEELLHPDHLDGTEHLHYDDTNSFHSSDRDLTAPSRRLSYGEPLDMIKARSDRKSAGPAEFYSKAGWMAEDKGCDSWIDDTIQARANRPYHSAPSRRMNRLWLDLIEYDEEIEEAHATAVTTSPSKPRMISICPRRVTTESSPGEPQSSSVSAFQPGLSTFLPGTPPQSPTPSIETPKRPLAPLNGLSIKTIDTKKQERQHEAFNRIRSRTTSSMTPPNSGVSTRWSSETVRRIVPLSPVAPASPAILCPATPPTIPANSGLKLSELTAWILTELETAIAGDANQALQLNNPVIQQLRLSPKQRKIPRQTPLTPARSSFSVTQGPLSSHSLPSYFAVPPPETSEGPFGTRKTSTTTPDATLTALCCIFPLAPRSTVSHLLATILAHQFVSSIHTPLLQQKSTTITSFAARHINIHSPPMNTILRYVDGLPEHIPSKARAMLGLPPPKSLGKPKDGRPPLPSFWRKVEKLEWRDRVGELESGLSGSVRRMVRELVGGEEWTDKARWLDALVCAIREAVRMGEAVAVAS